MSIYHWILLIGFAVFFIAAIRIIIRVLIFNRPKDYSSPIGNVSSGILYSFTGAMSPFKKESAYLHLPTYTAGMIFHTGTFLSFLWLILLFFNVPYSEWLSYASIIFLIASAICGISILIKRFIKANLRNMSAPDDYFSNMLVTVFQLCTALTLYREALLPVLFIYGSILFIYMPIGKLRHSIYFFTSRIYLGMYYGKRGVWKK